MKDTKGRLNRPQERPENNMPWRSLSRGTRLRIAEFIEHLPEPALQQWATDLFAAIVAEANVSRLAKRTALGDESSPGASNLSRSRVRDEKGGANDAERRA
jgi:hypothetical protein